LLFPWLYFLELLTDAPGIPDKLANVKVIRHGQGEELILYLKRNIKND
jgi:hypothetical protein